MSATNVRALGSNVLGTTASENSITTLKVLKFTSNPTISGGELSEIIL